MVKDHLIAATASISMGQGIPMVTAKSVFAGFTRQCCPREDWRTLIVFAAISNPKMHIIGTILTANSFLWLGALLGSASIWRQEF